VVSATGEDIILLVEDDAAVSQTFERMLRLAGYKVVAARTASAGLRAMVDAAPAAVLVDLRLPVMNGLELVRQIREREINGHRTPIAVITGDYLLDDSIRVRLRELQTDLYFKPLWLNDLLQIVDKLLD
jgi:DNA-binding response OmpR family regulator